jgi:hypothetical protein
VVFDGSALRNAKKMQIILRRTMDIRFRKYIAKTSTAWTTRWNHSEQLIPVIHIGMGARL